MSVTAVEQKYALTRIRAGDYLVPSNDGQQLWRLNSYYEDGSASFVDIAGKETPIKGTFWRALRFNGTVEEAEALLAGADPEALLEWDRWIESHSLLSARKEALTYALGDA